MDKRALLPLSAFLLLVLIPATALADTVTLAWLCNTEPDLAGYKVYYGAASRHYATVIDVHKVTTYSVTGLGPGTWYFSVTAYNTSGAESSYSSEVSTTITSPPVSRCDITGDGLINFSDAQLLANVLLGATVCPGNCDLNGDGKVDYSDLQTLLNVVLGLRTCP